MLKTLSNFPILFVDDDEMWLENTLRGLKILGLKKADGCSDPLDVLEILKNKDYGLVVIDLWMPKKPGEILLSEIKQHFPDIPVIITTADNQIETAIKCMQAGALNYLVKPIEPNKLITHIKRIITDVDSNTAADVSVSEAKNKLQAPVNYFSTLSQSVNMQKIFAYADSLSESILPILITGERGSGKKRLAESIHKAYRREGDFSVVDVAEIQNRLSSLDDIMAELKFITDLSCSGRTVYFDNSGEMDDGVQQFLLDSFLEIQDSSHHLGSNIRGLPRFFFGSTIDVIKEKTFIKDLEFVLTLQHISIPPLRERVNDIPLLVASFINEYVEVNSINPPYIPKELLPLLEQYHFPENVYELKKMIEYALSKCNRGKLSMDSIKEHMDINRDRGHLKDLNGIFSICKVLPTLKESQYLLIQEALRRADGNQAHAAHLLGITRQGLNRKIQSLGVEFQTLPR